MAKTICIRHDLDELNVDQFKELIRFEKELGIRSTCFALEYQIRDEDFLKELKKAGEDGFDIQLHSEPFYPRQLLWKRIFVKDATKFFIFNALKYFRSQKKLESFIRMNLIRQVKTYQDVGIEIKGHALHASNNYLPFSIKDTWKIFHKASQGTFQWISSYEKIIERKLEGKKELEEVRKSGNLMILPTNFDDTLLPKGKKGIIAAKERIKKLMKNNIPLTVGMHPYFFYNNTYNGWALEKWISKENNIKIITLSQLYEQLLKK